MISVNPNFISEDEVKILLDHAKSEYSHDQWDWSSPDQPFWNGRAMFANTIGRFGEIKNDQRSIKVYETLVDIHKRIRDHITVTRQLTLPLYTDTFQLVRWPEGTEQPPHADAEEPDGSPNPYPWRRYASIIYLNDDYEGGGTYFPNQDMEVIGEPGMMVSFPGTTEWLHGVRQVKNATRYTCAGFWCFDPTMADSLSK